MDLSDEIRGVLGVTVKGILGVLAETGQSLAIARQAMIDAFDAVAVELDASGTDTSE